MPIILLMDHSREGIESLAPDLEAKGYEVVVSNEIADSLSLAGSDFQPDLIIFTPLVLGTKGVESEIVQSFSKNATTPVLLVVDNLDKLDKAAALPIPIRNFVTLPLDHKEVLARVASDLRLRQEILTLQQKTEELSVQVIRDFKTGLYNARHFNQELRREFQRVNRTHRPLALLLLDLDNFKEVNDTTEYAFGDKVLANFAAAIQGNIREVDIAARFGGDEFMILLPGTTPAEAIQVASRIRNMSSRLDISDQNYNCNITVSIGVDCYNGQTTSTPEELRTRANRALQEAKRRGKNCIWLFAPPGTEGHNKMAAGSTPEN